MKKKLLFIDAQILQFDQTAGARTSYMYLKLLLELGVSVTFVGADFTKVEPYTSHLRSLGVRVLTGKWFQRAWKLWFFLFARQFDYVFFNRANPTKRFIGYIEKHSTAKTLYQCHDLHYLRLLRQYEVEGDANILKQSRQIEKLETELIRKSDVFLTFSQHEKDLIEEKLPGQWSEVVPLYFYEQLTPPITDFSHRHGILYVGGFVHKPNEDAVLWFARKVFPQILESCPDLVFYIVGSNPPVEITALGGRNIKVLGYVADDELDALYRRVRMVVVPLRYGAGVKGKTMEAIHHSLPLVSTGVGIEGVGLEPIVPPTDNPRDFASRVIALYEDVTALRQCSSQLHEYAQKNLSYPAARQKMKNILVALD
jgi:glycosyltransferase involved in cell wall biosynthesis